MVPFSLLPSDVLSNIWRLLPLGDLAALRQASSTIASQICEDKQLWIFILQVEVRSRNLPLPTYRLPLYEASASDIQSWVKHSFILDQKYSCGEVQSFRTTIHKGITWVKLIRGRWCFVASATFSQAILSVWDLSLSDLSAPCAKMSMAGPVTDGVVEDTGSHIHLALTVATSIPFVLILNLARFGDVVYIQRAGKILGASHVRLLRGCFVGYAVKDGVDDYPHIANWQSGEVIPLRYPLCDLSAIDPESIRDDYPLKERLIKPESCRAIEIWRNYLIVVLITRIHIFRVAGSQNLLIDDLSSFEEVTWLTSLALPLLTLEAHFSDLTGTPEVQNLGFQTPCLQVLLREDDGLFPVLLTCSEDARTGNNVQFAIHEVDGTACPKRSGNVARFIIGKDIRRVLWVGFPAESHPNTQLSMYMSALALDLVFANLPDEEKRAFVESHELKISPANGIPLMHTLSACDFDDGRGIAVLCTITGELCILDFNEDTTLPYDGLQDDLPYSKETVCPSEDNHDDEYDLPAFYHLPDNRSGEVASPVVIAEAHRLWKEPFVIRREIPGWSDDWTSFKDTFQWLVSWPRWGPQDLQCNHLSNPCLRIRGRLFLLGDIIPVLYSEIYPGRVICRSGEHMYFIKYRCDDDDDDDFNIYMNTEIIGMLPFTYSEFLTMDLRTIVSAIENRHIQTNLSGWGAIDPIVMYQSVLSFKAFNIRAYYQKKDGLLLDTRVMESWSEEEWDKNSSLQIRAWQDGFFDDYSECTKRTWI